MNTHLLWKHEISHALMSHLYFGDGGIEELQGPNHPNLQDSMIANCVMDKSRWQYICNGHLVIPIRMAGVIADMLAGCPWCYSMGDLEGIAYSWVD